MLPGAADLRRAGGASKLRFNDGTEAIRAQRVLTLKMQAYGSQVAIGDGLPDQLAVGGLPGRLLAARCAEEYPVDQTPVGAAGAFP